MLSFALPCLAAVLCYNVSFPNICACTQQCSAGRERPVICFALERAAGLSLLCRFDLLGAFPLFLTSLQLLLYVAVFALPFFIMPVCFS